MNVELTALICTRNRAAYVRKSIASLADQTLPRDQYEIIVVDNGSEDETRAVVQEFAHVPNLRYVYEPVPGLSKARNTGWQNACGEFVAYLDDDAVACREWAEKYLEVFKTFRPMPGSVGGKCEPIWEAPQPDWLSDRMLTSLSVYDWSDEPLILNEEQWVSGCNIGYPVNVLRRIGGFREDLGRIGKKLLSGEETYVRRQLDALGLTSVYHPEIVVGHHVSPMRLNKTWFRRHAYGTGQSQALMLTIDHPLPTRRRAGLGLKKMAWVLPRLPLMVASASPADRFRRQYQVLESIGYVTALWRPST
jgi:glucosyl-dolichyl phosphate glucuronosyltransferase